MGFQPPERKRAFNEVASLYNEIRPGYPEHLIDDVVSLSSIPPSGRILEIGCGTGQATEPFARRGYRMVCLDIGERLVAIASARFCDFDNVRIVLGSFEDWQPDSVPFDVVMAATSFHWIDSAVRYHKAAAVLAPSGALAVIHTNHVRRDEGFFVEVESLYRQHYDPPKPSSPMEEDPAQPPEPGSECFCEPIHRTYPWSQEYDADQYIRLLGTYSDHIRLPPARREALFAGIRALIDSRYGGRILKHHETALDVFVRRP